MFQFYQSHTPHRIMPRLATLVSLAIVYVRNFAQLNQNLTDMHIIGLRIDTENVLVRVDNDGTPCISPKPSPIKLTFFGTNIKFDSSLHIIRNNQSCTANFTTLEMKPITLNPNSFTVQNEFSESDIDSDFHFCTERSNETAVPLGNSIHLKVVEPEDELYFVLVGMILVMVILLACSGILSGLNLGLMTIDLQELAIIQKAGTDKEKKYAARIYPLRKNGNQLLCTLLLSNVIVNTAFTQLMDNIVMSMADDELKTNTALIVTAITSILIVIFGEILPQSICTRYGLAVGGNMVCSLLTRFFMIVTSPVTYPLSILLDKLLGVEMGKVYNKERLLELIKQQQAGKGQQGIGNEPEIMIVRGALNLKKKTAGEIMTRFDDVYMISKEDVLDGHKLFEILGKGFTRIPVYDGTKDNILGIINMRDLVLYDPDDKVTAETVCKHYNHQLKFVLPSTTLHQLLEDFRKGETHLAFVKVVKKDKVNQSSRISADSIHHNSTTPEDDPTLSQKIAGVVTLEDVMEEIIGQEINDEKDVLIDNQTRTKRKIKYSGYEGVSKPDISTAVAPQLSLAAYQHLIANCPPFSSDMITEHVLRKLLADNIIQKKPPITGANGNYEHLYEKGKDSDCFCLILEGRVEISVGAENLDLEGGPFMKFGEKAIENAAAIAPKKSVSATKGQDISIFKSCAWKPDFTVTVKHDVIYFWINSSQFLDAYHASQLARNASKRAVSKGPPIARVRGKANLEVTSPKPESQKQSISRTIKNAKTAKTQLSEADKSIKTNSSNLPKTSSQMKIYRHRFGSQSPTATLQGDISTDRSPNKSSLNSTMPKIDRPKVEKLTRNQLYPNEQNDAQLNKPPDQNKVKILQNTRNTKESKEKRTSINDPMGVSLRSKTNMLENNAPI